MTGQDGVSREQDALLTQLLDGVGGWLPTAEARYLCALASEATADIVEIGCYRGRSTIALCVGAAASGRLVHSIDPHRPASGALGGRFGPLDREIYYRNMLASGMAQRAALINLPSEQAGRSWNAPVGLLFIDGDHRYEGVLRDVDVWLPHLVPGGVAVFHDAQDPRGGPHQVIAELVAGGSFHAPVTVGKMRSLGKL